MIFGNNSTTLGASSIAIDENYNCSYGAALALVEGAQNDYAMFKAMIGADYKEINICRESAGYVRENELSSLHEATEGGLWKKIKDFFIRLATKIKSIFNNFIAKITSLWKDDKKYVDAHLKDVENKSNIGNLAVKWRKVKDNIEWDTKEYGSDISDLNKLAELYTEDKSERYKKYTGNNDVDSVTEFQEAFEKELMEDEVKETKIKDIGGITAIADFLKGYSKKINKMKEAMNSATSSLTNLAKQAESYKDKTASGFANGNKNKDTDETYTQNDVDVASHAYAMAQIKQDIELAKISVIQKLSTIEYKQNKAAFVKAVTANNDKLAESAYLDAVAEAAADEVEDVISSAMSDEEISKISNASKAVKDADVSDCPSALTYGPDYYGRNAYGPADGSVDTDINSKEESAFFGKLLY